MQRNNNSENMPSWWLPVLAFCLPWRMFATNDNDVINHKFQLEWVNFTCTHCLCVQVCTLPSAATCEDTNVHHHSQSRDNPMTISTGSSLLTCFSPCLRRDATPTPNLALTLATTDNLLHFSRFVIEKYSINCNHQEPCLRKHKEVSANSKVSHANCTNNYKNGGYFREISLSEGVDVLCLLIYL